MECLEFGHLRQPIVFWRHVLNLPASNVGQQEVFSLVLRFVLRVARKVLPTFRDSITVLPAQTRQFWMDLQVRRAWPGLDIRSTTKRGSGWCAIRRMFRAVFLLATKLRSSSREGSSHGRELSQRAACLG